MSDHTPEPWTDLLTPMIKAYDDRLIINGARTQVACRILSEPNYQRAKACVNACAKIRPEKLQALFDAVQVMLNVADSMGTNLKGTTNQLRRAFEDLRPTV